MSRMQEDQRGIAQIVLIVIIVVVVGALGFAGYTVMNKNKKSNTSTADAVNKVVNSKAAQAECLKTNDKDICKFYTSWKANSKYRMTTTDPSGGKMIFEIDGNKSRMVMTGETAYEIITIDKTTYTKAGSVWYKQTPKPTEKSTTDNIKPDFSEPTNDTEESKTTYKLIGKEACGNLTCFKYEVIDSKDTTTKEFIWFDDKDYQMRKTRTESSDGASESVYEYGNVSISTPSPVKELGPNQYIAPGQTEPMTLPSVDGTAQ